MGIGGGAGRLTGLSDLTGRRGPETSVISAEDGVDGPDHQAGAIWRTASHSYLTSPSAGGSGAAV